VPAPLRRQDLLKPRERVLAVARLSGGGYAAATPDALVVADGPGSRRLPWHQVASAAFVPDAGELVLDELTTPSRRLRLRLAEPGSLPETVRERVRSNIVVSEHVALIGRSGARIIGRRTPDSDALTWQLVFDAGLDPADPAVRARAEQALARLRAATGA
jgi:hypothetical protein